MSRIAVIARSRLAAVGLFTIFAMAGCSSEGGSGSPLTNLGIDDGASKGLSASKTASAEMTVQEMVFIPCESRW